MGFIEACRAAVKDAEGRSGGAIERAMRGLCCCRGPLVTEDPPTGTSGLCLRRRFVRLTLAHLCPTFASAIITTPPPRIPPNHQERPVFHRAWRCKSRYTCRYPHHARTREQATRARHREHQEAQGARAERKKRRKTRTRQALGNSSWPRRLTHRLSYCHRQRLLN